MTSYACWRILVASRMCAWTRSEGSLMVITAGPPNSRLGAARHISAADSGGSSDMSFTISPNGPPARDTSSIRHRRCETRGERRRPARAHPDLPRPPSLQPRRAPPSSLRERRPGPKHWSHDRRVSGTCRWLPRACAGLGTPYASVCSAAGARRRAQRDSLGPRTRPRRRASPKAARRRLGQDSPDRPSIPFLPNGIRPAPLRLSRRTVPRHAGRRSCSASCGTARRTCDVDPAGRFCRPPI